jgi:hypothetical protein
MLKMNVTIRIEEPRLLEIRADWETARLVADFLLGSPESPLKEQTLEERKEEGVAKTPLRFPPPGQRIIDFAEQACRKLGKSKFTPSELIPLMIAEGWQTTSKAPVLTLRSTLRESKGLFANHKDGTWSYLGNGSGRTKKAEGRVLTGRDDRSGTVEDGPIREPSIFDIDSARVP